MIQKIVVQLGFELDDIFGEEEATHVAKTISQAAQDVTKEVRERVGKLKSKMSVLSAKELGVRRSADEPKFVHVRYTSGQATFTRKCPACESKGSLSAAPIGATPPRLTDDGIVSQSIYWPMKFECKVCGLNLNGYEELQVVDLGDQIVDEDTHDPVEYLGIDVSEYITDEMIRESIRDDYNNE